MNLRSTAGGLSSRFAHLLGTGRKAAVKAADDDAPEKEKDPDAGDDEDPDKKDSDASKGKAEGDDPEKEKDTDAGDDDGDDDDKAEKAAASARGEERARCAAIFAAPEAAGNVALACELAFGTDLTPKQAIAALKVGGTGSASRGGLSDRMEGAPRINLGGDAPRPAAGSADAHADSVIAAMRKARGQSKGG